MTIGRGEPWGREVPRPADLLVVDDDAALVDALTTQPTQPTQMARPVAVGGGDLARTLGSPSIAGRQILNELPIDLMQVRLDGGAHVVTACAHLVARSRWFRGSWWRGPALLVMNSEFRGRWDVAPRGHPNDGRVETFEVDATFGWRDRLAARRRVRIGAHVPHPAIRTRSVRAARWSFEAPLAVEADGRYLGTAMVIEVEVIADAATVHA